MRIHLITVGKRVPPWVKAGFQEYAKRLVSTCQLHLIEIPPAKRAQSTAGAVRVRQDEAKRIAAAIPPRAWVVALDEHGQLWTSSDLAQHLKQWMQAACDVALLVGGADGLDRSCLEKANQRWSLSPLTLPHALVRILVAEQIYRAWTMLSHHPYHRA